MARPRGQQDARENVQVNCFVSRRSAFSRWKTRTRRDRWLAVTSQLFFVAGINDYWEAEEEREREREREKKIDKNESPFLDPRHLQPRRNIGKNIQMLAPSIRDYHHDTAIDFQRPLERPIGDESPINVA